MIVDRILKGSQIIKVCSILEEKVDNLKLAEDILNGKQVTLEEADTIINEGNRLHLAIVNKSKSKEANAIAEELGFIKSVS